MDVILNAYDLRNDELGQLVRLRLEGAVSDLHAADAQYHKDCMDAFRGNRNIHYSKSKEDDLTEKAWKCLISEMDKDRS